MGTFGFGQGYFGQYAVGGDVIIPPLEEPRVVEMFACYRAGVPVRASYQPTIALPSSYRASVPTKGSH